VSTTISAAWRGIAKRTTETANIFAKPSRANALNKVVLMHARALTKVIDCFPKSARNDLTEHFSNFAASFQLAVDLGSATWLRSLASLAARKAELIENTVLVMRRAHWKHMVGVTVEDGSTRAPRPTKAAYRYIRGVDGWTTSPIGDNKFNDNVTAEPRLGPRETDDDNGTYDELSTFVPDDTGLIAARFAMRQIVKSKLVSGASCGSRRKPTHTRCSTFNSRCSKALPPS